MKRKIVFWLAVGILVSTVNAFTQSPGVVDVSFGDNGILIADANPNGVENLSAIVQNEQTGDFLFIGATNDFPLTSMVLSKHSADGDFDNEFGNQGRLILNYGTKDSGRDAVFLANGKILLAGYSYQQATQEDIMVAKLNSDGSPDLSFGINGAILIDVFSGSEDDVSRMSVFNDKIYVAGTFLNRSNTSEDYYILRLNLDGSPDNSFGNNGVVTLNIFDVLSPGVRIDDVLTSIGFQSDGKIILGGYSYTSEPKFILIRLFEDGGRDLSFGNIGSDLPGIAFIETGDDEGDSGYLMDLKVLADNSIIAVGRTYWTFGTSGLELTVVKLDVNGNTINSFGVQGIATIFGDTEFLTSAVIQNDGKILLAATDIISNVESKIVAFRLNQDGTLDTSFGNSGSTIVSAPRYNFQSRNAFIQNGDRFIISGNIGNLDDEFGAVRFFLGDIQTAGCSINDSGLAISSCNNSNTSDDSLDDTFVFSVNPVGNNLSATYSIFGDVNLSNILFGQPIEIDNNGNGFLISNGSLNINIVDDSDPGCTLMDIEVQPPASCSGQSGSAPWPISCNNNGNIQLVHIQYDYFSSDMGDGTPLEEGDWIGIFYQAEDGSLMCTDAQPFPPSSDGGFFLSACGESAAGADDGFEAGEQIKVKVFKNGVEYTPNQLIVDFHSQFFINPVFPDTENTFQGNFANSAIQRIERLRIIEPDCDDPITISCPVVLTGQSNSNGISEAISYNCFSNLVNGPEMIYSFNNPATQDVRICMDNLQDDLELLLMDECDKDHCIAKSERTGTSPEVIVYQELPMGDYFIFVEGYLGYESTYDLSLECGQFNPGSLSCSATTIQCDGIITGHTNTGCAEASAYPCSEGYYPGNEKLYRFKSDEGGYVTIRLQPESQDLDLFLLEQGNRELCITSSTESGLELEQIEVNILPDKYYYILVDEYKTENTSDFTLSLYCHDGGGPQTPPCFSSTLCTNGEEILCNTPITGHTNTGIDCIEKWGSCLSFNTGPEVIYRFNNTEDLQDVIINLDGFSENLNLYILDACSPSACREGWSSNKSGLIPEGVVIPAMPPGEYYIVVDTYSGGASSAFNLEIQCNSTVLDCFEVEVPEGVSYISSNVVPNDPSMFYLIDENFKDVIDVISNDQMQNYAPGYTDPNDPSFSIIKEWNTVDGYRVVSSSATTLTFCGEKSDPDLLKDVVAFETNGTTPFSNYIFYPFENPEYVEQVFEPTAIENINQIQYIYPNNSFIPKFYFFFCGATNPNGDTDFLMEAGKGYILKVCTDGSFSYRSPEEKYFENGCVFFRMPMQPLENSSWIKISSELLNPLLQPGDEIAFFNEEGQVVGSHLFTGFNLIMTISGDMPQTEPVEGMIEEEPFNAKIWCNTSGRIETLDFTFKTHENAFLPHTVYEINDLRVSEANVETTPTLKCSVFPNPARHTLSLSIFLPHQDNAQVSLFDLKGKRHQFYEWPSLNGGTHQLDLHLGDLPAGVYYLKVRAESGVFTERVILAP
ncbi:MAG: T9SS type A sorting domain-containing protein [Lewinellaceae bacterium]|nr:T9SS type A sorting domain-containing protein [Lewinellaceae bacterium]